MKRWIALTLAPAFVGGWIGADARAGLLVGSFGENFENQGNIPDGSAVPWSDTRQVVGVSSERVDEVRVRLDLTGGFNGDVYAYLSHDGILVPLLNRVGVGTGQPFGYSESGMDVTFADEGLANIHFYRDVSGFDLGGGVLWQPDGRLINPLTSQWAEFNNPPTIGLDAFRGKGAAGDWTLVIADLSAGGGQARVVGWELALITAVPELSSGWLVVIGLITFGGIRWCRRE